MNQVERRGAKRFTVNLPARWEGGGASDVGTISDMSMTGCFMLTAGMIEKGEAVVVTATLPGDATIVLGGEVVYYTEEIGFAIRFTEGNELDKRGLAAFLKQKLAETSEAQPT
jgi:hypothetical protein